MIFRFPLIFVMVAIANMALSNCPTSFNSNAENTFGVVVCSSPSISSKYHLHAEMVLRKLLDYDNDSRPDNKKVLKEMLANRATFLILRDEDELDLYENTLEKYFSFTVVYKDEMVLDQALEFDASIEEGLHLVTAEGYSKAYPESFGEFKGSAIAAFLDVARGGYFEDVPIEYPSEAYFTYYDETCDYACQITEFLYWAITTLRGQQRYNWRDSEIEQEWRPESSAKLKKIAPSLVKFLSKSEFSILY